MRPEATDRATKFLYVGEFDTQFHCCTGASLLWNADCLPARAVESLIPYGTPNCCSLNERVSSVTVPSALAEHVEANADGTDVLVVDLILARLFCLGKFN